MSLKNKIEENLMPLKNLILVSLIPPKKSMGKIAIPDSEEASNKGIVIAKGGEVTELEVGDEVVFSPSAVRREKSYAFISEEDVLVYYRNRKENEAI